MGKFETPHDFAILQTWNRHLNLTELFSYEGFTESEIVTNWVQKSGLQKLFNTY